MRLTIVRWRLATFALLLAALVTAACKKSDTSPTATITTTTTTTAVAAPNTSETFTGRVGVGETRYFPFTVAEFGTVNAGLTAVSGSGVPATVQMRLGLGTISDDSCVTSSVSLVRPGTATQLTTTFSAGTYCVLIQDVGNLFNAATVTVTVAHP